MYIDPGSGGCWPRRRASLVDKGKPDVSRGRKATGPTRSAGLPNGKNMSCAGPPTSSARAPVAAVLLVPWVRVPAWCKASTNER
jgi:hypothetical protein